MALQQPTMFAGQEHAEAYHAIGNYSYTEYPPTLFVQMYLWRDAAHKDAYKVSLIPEEVEGETVYPDKVEGPLRKFQVPVTLDSIGSKENITLANLYAQIKSTPKYVGSIDV